MEGVENDWRNKRDKYRKTKYEWQTVDKMPNTVYAKKQI